MYQTKAAFFAGPVFILSVICLLLPANADTFSFNTGLVTNSMASASRPDSTGKFEIESADDFVTTGTQTSITSGTFTGLLTGATPAVQAVTVEIYRVFPLDSTVPPSGHVITRNNSPSDVALDSRDSSVAGSLNFTTAALAATFTALNSVQPGGIHPSPAQTTGGNGQITGQELQFNITFSTPFNLAAGQYFFVPQVQVSGGEFYWLSGTRPNSAFPAGFTDLQSWTRDANLDPDWSRIGQDIVGGNPLFPTFNAAFSLDGVAVPGPVVGAGLPGLIFASGGFLAWWRRKRNAAVSAA